MRHARRKDDPWRMVRYGHLRGDVIDLQTLKFAFGEGGGESEPFQLALAVINIPIMEDDIW